MSLTSTLFAGIASLSAIPGGPYAAGGVAALVGGTLIGGVWLTLNPYPAAERRVRADLSEPRRSRYVLMEDGAVNPLDIPLDVVPRDTDQRTPYDVVGPDAIRTVVDQFYSHVLADPDLRGYFTGVDMSRLRRHQAQIIAQLWGGPVAFPLSRLAEAHEGMRISPEAYWKVVGHLMLTLTRSGVPDWICVFTMTRLYQARTLIVADTPDEARLNPESLADPDPDLHTFEPSAGGVCVCGADELSPRHYAPAGPDAGTQP